MARIRFEFGEHWRWTGSLRASPRGWFRMGSSVRSKVANADRAGWELFRGEVPAGMVVRYCPGCWSPWHARLATDAELHAELSKSGPAAHAASGRPAAAKITRERAAIIRLWLDAGYPPRDIKRRLRLPIGLEAIYAIKRGRTWRGA